MRDLAVSFQKFPNHVGLHVTFMLSPVGKLGFFVDFGFKMHIFVVGGVMSV